uniref:Uncharacterized protein n=1 Tax=Vespula pensylvanica TaxID=30213 RepID=A0A834KRL3_VESPE|nr:hypothetical protein H0235_012645 [Vespula pensylvanica]
MWKPQRETSAMTCEVGRTRPSAAPESLPSPQNTAAAAAVAAAAADAADAVAAAAAAAAMWQHQQERLTGDARSSPNSYETNNDDAKETMWKPRGVADAPSVPDTVNGISRGPRMQLCYLWTTRMHLEQTRGQSHENSTESETVGKANRQLRATLPIPYPPSIIPSGVPQTSVPQMLRYNLYNCEEISIKNGGNVPTEKCLLVDLVNFSRFRATTSPGRFRFNV